MKKVFVLILLIMLTIGGMVSAKEKLVISTWGYNGDLLKKYVYAPFEEKYDVEIVLETGNNAARLNKLKLRKGKGTDLIYLASSYTMDAIEAGLIEKIDRSNLPNISQIYQLARAPFGNDYGPAYTVMRVGIIYDTAQISEPITSWNDLWRSDLTRKISVPNITTTAGPTIVLTAGRHVNVDAFQQPDLAFKSLKKMKTNVLKTYNRSSNLANMFAQGEISVGVALNFVMGRVKKAVPSAVWVDPAEGSYASINTINVVKGTPKKELAEKFINHVLSEKIQLDIALVKVDSPVNVNVKLSLEQAEGLTYGKDLIAGFQNVDWGSVNSRKKEWINNWNEIFSN
ncbi:MAG: ABC transporter substrate-binding protein [Candidatus Marinimicrobia bacterium]|jgi:putative spermidine/putrescine transport system substrate-binding protein|nr:ABC transporter substrate-binding protein [Candidatus Neomarinimicrobiota bacterium]MBT6638439.1 ABC transporter substrate-binding protein [Candidatus Neomarinimicrobiota bacterium]